MSRRILHIGSAAAAPACLAAALLLALHHPIAPAAAVAGVALATYLAAIRRGVWLSLLPATLPWLDFSPWTGWLGFDEFDLLLLGLCAGAHGARAIAVPPPHLRTTPHRALLLTCLGLLAAAGLVSLLRGLLDAGWVFGWFQGYEAPMNTLRVAKSGAFAALLLPLLRDELQRHPRRALRRLAHGMVAGLAVTSVAALWERLANPGLLNFEGVYRVTALFWEMHVGGGAIDAYLAMATPFAVWSLAMARTRGGRMLAGTLVLLAAYACLCTFSRGVYGALLTAAGVATVLAWRQRRRARGALEPPVTAPPRAAILPWPASALHVVLLLLLATLLAAIFGPTTFMSNRLAATDAVLEHRLEHWTRALALRSSDAQAWLGVGLGRFPSRYDRATPGGHLPGSVDWRGGRSGSETDSHATLRGPATDPDIAGLFALTQRVRPEPGRRYELDLELRVPAATLLSAELCERHLLYDRRCQVAWLRLPNTHGQWQRRTLVLSGSNFRAGPWYAPRLGMLALSVPDIGGSVDLRRVALRPTPGADVLVNGDFRAGLSRWFPAAQLFFLPWHIDNLYLEMLIEAGWGGLAAFALLLALACVGIARAGPSMAGVLGASLSGVMVVAAVSSILDAPRVALLLWLLLLACAHLPADRSRGRPACTKGGSPPRIRHGQVSDRPTATP